MFMYISRYLCTSVFIQFNKHNREFSVFNTGILMIGKLSDPINLSGGCFRFNSDKTDI